MINISNKTKFLIEQFGQEIQIVDPSQNVVYAKAFIQPLRSDYQSPLYADYLENQNDEQYLYIGMPGVNLSSYPSGTVIKLGEVTYDIKKVEYVYFSGNVVYERAVLEESSS